MTRAPRRAVWIGAGVALLLAAAAAGLGGPGAAPPAPDAVRAQAVPCGSCTARHQRLTRAPSRMETTP